MTNALLPSAGGACAGHAVPAAGPMVISDDEFLQIREWIHRLAGIRLSDQKKALVVGRLAKRLRHHRLSSYGDYFRLLVDGLHFAEAQIAVDLLTTNETHFFREPRHFDFLREQVLPAHPRGRPFRAWSAASSSGEEPYSIGMTLADRLGDGPWQVLASDLSVRVLERAQTGHYLMQRAGGIPPDLLRTHCLRGTGSQEGTFLVDSHIRDRVQFRQINLNAPLPGIGEFDVIFLRNVMIYFDMPTKREVVARIVGRMRPGGYLFVGHSESLNGVSEAVKPLKPSIYVRVRGS